MRLVSYVHQGRSGYGRIDGDEIEVLGTEAAGERPTLRHWLAQRAEGSVGHPTGAVLPLSAVTLLPPIPDAGKILCVATNFREPATANKPLPDYPLTFTRFADSLVGHGAPLIRPPESSKLDFEGEVAVVIGRPGHRIPPARAMEHVAGYACFNDGSVRDWQKHSSQFTPGKNFWRSGSFGPWLVTADEITDPSSLRLETRVNGRPMQAISLDSFIFDIPWLIAYMSTITPLSPGDVIATGTPSGFGSTRQPPVFLEPGDVVEVEVASIGLLRNRVEEG